MRFRGTVLALCVLFGSAMANPGAHAAPPDGRPEPENARPAKPAGQAHVQPATSRQSSASHNRSGRLSCVPYARMVTGMEIRGDGWTWWRNASGRYARGRRPEPGSVMAFRATGGMSRGHVAVVSQVLGPRHVLINHANWAGPGIRRGTVMRNVSVIDVSEENDWTAVRVQTGYDPTTYGRVYPIYGFIYNRPDTAFASAPARDARHWEQIAEAPETMPARTSTPHRSEPAARHR